MPHPCNNITYSNANAVSCLNNNYPAEDGLGTNISMDLKVT